MMKFGMLSASVLLMALTGCTTHESEEDIGDAPGSWVNSGGSGPVATGGSGPVGTGGGPVAGGATGTGGAEGGAGGESSDCNQVVAECYSQAYACCGQGVDEQCEMMAGNCASIICNEPNPYPLECHDYLVPVGEGVDEIQAFELAVNTCSNLGLSATSAELLELGVFVTCCPDTSGGGMGTGGSSWGAGGSTGGYAGEPLPMGSGGYEAGTGGTGTAGAGGYSMGGTGSDESTGAGGYSTGGTGMGGVAGEGGVGGIGVGGTGMGGSGPVIPGFCSGIGGEGGFAGEGGMGGIAGEGGTGGFAGEGGFATGGMPAD